MDAMMEGLESTGSESKQEARGLDSPTKAFAPGGIPRFDSNGSHYVVKMKAGEGNTHITVYELTSGKSVLYASCGTIGFKKSKRGMPEMAHQLGSMIARKLNEIAPEGGLVDIHLKGFGKGRTPAYQAFTAHSAFHLNLLADVTPIRFGGCRPKKMRRL